ncbi:MAG: type IV toxin-antitoxin system AbiEi family antitoxin domain-containing protein [Acidimicrobiia bacterium]|jgi:very-short-patch-repair endonuclease
MSLAPEHLAALADLAGRQYGCFTRAQCRAIGISASTVDRRVASHEWVTVDHGVYRTALTPTSWHQRVLAACLAGPAVASHRCAAALQEAPGFDTTLVEVTARRHRRRTSTDVTWHESHHLDDHDVEMIDGIPATKAVRTLIDLGSVLDERGLTLVLDDFLRRRLVTVGAVVRRLEELGPRRRGSSRVRRVLDRRAVGDPVPESVLESELALLVREFGLPAPQRQVVVHDDDDGFVGRLDFAYSDLKIDIEVDGTRWHSSPDAQRRDADRDTRLQRLGWVVLRFDAADIRHRPAWVAERIRLAIFERTTATTQRG